MASAAPVQGIQEETMCPICLEYLTDPVTMDCGHNFCQGCISTYCDKWEGYGPLECPVCRDRIQKGNLRPNWQLGNIVGKIRQLELNPSKENLCETHQEKLNLFCEEDREAVCVACWRSPQHRSHRVLLMEDTAQKYKDQIQLHLQSLMKESDEIPAVKLREEKRLLELLAKTEAERQKIVSVFTQLHQFLEDQERLPLAQLEKLDKGIRKSQDENATRVSKEIPRLSELIGEMEETCRQPASKFLQDLRSTLSRYMAPPCFAAPGKDLATMFKPCLPRAPQLSTWGWVTFSYKSRLNLTSGCSHPLTRCSGIIHPAGKILNLKCFLEMSHPWGDWLPQGSGDGIQAFHH
ncbi:tripartite motif-containing protein 10-like isoform X1 [Lepidochelys kempii]|uniref:tripartite motif-containing protein 10-like isoform X1 n=1 Tax=Lepidochelys kempii TaxID=8472 RepID=UPI003C701148